jgi:hypothetical protein
MEATLVVHNRHKNTIRFAIVSEQQKWVDVCWKETIQDARQLFYATCNTIGVQKCDLCVWGGDNAYILEHFEI